MIGENILRTTIVADNKVFVDKLKESNQQLSEFKKKNESLKDSFSNSIGTITKFAGTIGAIAGSCKLVFDSFKTTQQGADFLEKSTYQLEGAFTSLQQQIATMNFENFFSNILKSIDLSGKLQEKLDALGDYKFSYDLTKSDFANENEKLKEIIQNSKDPKKKKEAFEQLKKNFDIQEKELQGLKRQSEESLIAYFNQKLNNTKTGYRLQNTNELKQFIRDFKEVVKNNGNDKGKRFEHLQTYDNTLVQLITNGAKLNNKLQEKQELLKTDKKEVALHLLNNLMNDDARKELYQYVDDLNKIEQQLYSEKKSLQRYESKALGKEDIKIKIDTPKKDDKKNVVKEIELTKQSLENLSKIDFVFHFDTIFDRSTKYIQKLNSEIDLLLYRQKQLVLGSDEWSKVQNEIDKKRGEINNVKKLTIPNLSLPTLPTEKKDGENDNKFDIENVEKYTQAISNLASAFSYLNQQQENSLLSFLSYTSNILGSIGKLIASFQALAISKSVSSTAEIPFLGIINAISSVAQLTAIFSSLPKFSQGGIVGGTSYQGDKILARLNSGEGVLTKQGLSNLNNLFSNNNQGTLNGNVRFEIQGSKLYGVLENYKNLNKL